MITSTKNDTKYSSSERYGERLHVISVKKQQHKTQILRFRKTLVFLQQNHFYERFKIDQGINAVVSIRNIHSFMKTQPTRTTYFPFSVSLSLSLPFSRSLIHARTHHKSHPRPFFHGLAHNIRSQFWCQPYAICLFPSVAFVVCSTAVSLSLFFHRYWNVCFHTIEVNSFIQKNDWKRDRENTKTVHNAVSRIAFVFSVKFTSRLYTVKGSMWKLKAWRS